MKLKTFLLILTLTVAISSCSFKNSDEFKAMMLSNAEYIKTLDSSTISKNALNHVIQGSNFQMQEKYAEAVLEFQDALRYDSTAGIYYCLGYAYLQAGKPDLAILNESKAIKLQAKFIEAYKVLADAHLAKYDYDGAILVYSDLVKFYKNNSAKAYLARLYDLNGNFETAYQMYSDTNLAYTNADIINRLANIAFSAKDSSKYVFLNKKGIELFPEDHRFPTSLFLMNVLFGNIKESVKYYDLMAKILPEAKLTQYYINLSNAVNRSSKDTMNFYYNTVLNRSTEVLLESNKVNLSLGLLASSRDDSLSVDKYFEQAMEISDTIVDIPITWANFYLTTNASKSLEILNKYEKKYSSESSYPDSKSYVYINLEKYDSALVENNKARKLKPDDLDLLGTRAYILSLMKQYKKSDSISEYILSKKSDLISVCNNYAYDLAERNENLTYAHKLIQEALKKEPNNSSFLDTYGWVKYKMGDLDIAIAYLKDALNKARKPSAEIYDHLAEVYCAKNLKDDALKNWEEAIKINPKKQAEYKKKIARCSK